MTYDALPSSYRNGIIFLSTLIFVGGAAILGAALWTVVRIAAFQTLVGTSAGIFISAFLMVGIGSFMFFISFLGCVAAVTEKKSLLALYAVLIMLVFLVELIGSVLAFVFYPVAREEAQQSIRLYDDSASIREAWDDIQGILECCGINDYTDWKQRLVYPTLPPSCCSDDLDSCNVLTFTRWPTSCDAKVEGFFVAIGALGLSILFVEILTIGAIGCAFRAMSFRRS